ncbi:MAG TPA: hypothetical protein VIL65_05775 [Beijerinckiaceae bacterium]|jgi:hypothetical protein
MVEPSTGRRRDLLWRLAPVLTAGLAVALMAGAGLDAATLRGTALAGYGYGYFLVRQPLFAFAIVYGLARILIVGLRSDGPAAWRLFGLPAGAGLFLAACLYPTFGGLVLRAGFFGAAGPYLRGGMTAEAAFLIGAFVTGVVYAAILGFAVILARGRLRASSRPVRRALASAAALVAGALILGGAGVLGWEVWGDWPSRPFDAPSALASLAVVTLAFLPHALVSPMRGRASTERVGT